MNSSMNIIGKEKMKPGGFSLGKTPEEKGENEKPCFPARLHFLK
jgi:hypothetical protein|tara:strand:- start:859 stop:990 length:132 start_codon:yes stop_codon:yes gene_type:complete